MQHVNSRFRRINNYNYIDHEFDEFIFGSDSTRKNLEKLKQRMTQKSKSHAQYLRRKHQKDRKLTQDRQNSRDMKIARFEASVGAIDSRHGVEMISRPVTSIAERLGYADEHDTSDATIRETTWDLSRMIERPTLVGTFDWGQGMSRLANFAVPGDLLNVSLIKIPFQSFQYWRGDLVLRLQVAGSPLLQGVLAMTFIPLVTTAEANQLSTGDLATLTLNPTVYLYANVNTMAELRIPFNSPFSYLNTDYILSNTGPLRDALEGSLGKVLIYPLLPFQTSGSVASISCSLFTIFENNNFKVPRNSRGITAKLARAESLVTSALGSLADIGGSLASTAVNTMATSVKDTITQFTKNSKTEVEDHANSAAMPLNFIGDVLDVAGDALGSALSFFGLDNPTIPTESGRHIVKSNGSMNYAQGPEYVEKLQIAPASLALTTAETFGSITDEMNLSYLCSRYSYFGSFNVSATQVPGTIVFSCPLSPFPTVRPNSVSVSYGSFIQQNVSFPLLSYLGIPFRFWTGGLRIKMIVSASMMHTTKLFCAFNYGEYTGGTTTLLDVTSQYGAAIEVSQGSNEFELSIPYVATTPYLNVFDGNVNASNSMGTFNVVVMNQLVAPASVVSQIQFALFIAGGEDFSYEMLGSRGQLIPTDNTTIVGRAKPYVNRAEDVCTDVSKENVLVNAPIAFAESGVDTSAPTNIATTVTDIAEHADDEEIAPPQIEATVDNHFGLSNFSIREYLKRYQLCNQVSMTQLVGSSWGYSFSPSDLFVRPIVGPYAAFGKMATGLTSSIMGWASGMYRQFKGGLRFKIVITAPSAGILPSYSYAVFLPGGTRALGNTAEDIFLDLLQHSPPTSQGVATGGASLTTSQAMSSRCTVLNGVISNILEFEIPYSSRLLSTLVGTTDPVAGESFPLGRINVYTTSFAKDAPTCTIYCSFADETRFGTLYKIPNVWVGSAYAGTTQRNSAFAFYAAPSMTWAMAEGSTAPKPTQPIDIPRVGTVPVDQFDLSHYIDPVFVAKAESGIEDTMSNLSLSEKSTVNDKVSGEMRISSNGPELIQRREGRAPPPSHLRVYTRRRRPPVLNHDTVLPALKRKINTFVSRNPGCSMNDLERFLTSWARYNRVPQHYLASYKGLLQHVNIRGGRLYPRQLQVKRGIRF